MEQGVKKNELGARIAEAAFTLFKQYGVRSITLDEIALQLGISKKTIYEHFTGKNELVTEIVRHRIRLTQEKFIELTRQSVDAIEANILMMQYTDSLFRNMNPIVLVDLKKYHPEAFKVYQEHMNGFLVEAIRTNIRRGIREGLYREDINIEVMAYYRVESCNLCFQPDAFPKDHFEMSRVQRELLEHFLFGLATEKGYALLMQYRKKILT